MRKAGYTYPEILREVTVAKSTLWSWLRGIDLSDEVKEQFRLKEIARAEIASKAWHEMRASRTTYIQQIGVEEVGSLSARELWLLGVALYWAEGSKEKEHSPGSGVAFSNSDPKMIQFFQRWLLESCSISKQELVYELYIHQNRRADTEDMVRYWAVVLGCESSHFRVYYKTHKPKTVRKNVDADYRGLIRIKVRRSSELVRKIDGWTSGIVLT